MILLGHEFVQSELLYHISDIDAVVKTPPNSTMYLPFSKENMDIVEYLQANNIAFALAISSIKEAILAENLGAKYLVCHEDIVKQIQNIANEYLFSSKVLVHIHDEDEIEKYAVMGVDGALFPEAVIKVSG